MHLYFISRFHLIDFVELSPTETDLEIGDMKSRSNYMMRSTENILVFVNLMRICGLMPALDDVATSSCVKANEKNRMYQNKSLT